MSEQVPVQESVLLRRARVALAAALPVAAIAWTADLHRQLGLALYTEQYLAFMLGLGPALVFVHVPAGRPLRSALPWVGAIAAGRGLAACLYGSVRYPGLADRVSYRTPDVVALGAVFIALCLEGLRRTVGWGLAMFVVICIGWALVGPHVPGPLQARPV